MSSQMYFRSAAFTFRRNLNHNVKITNKRFICGTAYRTAASKAQSGPGNQSDSPQFTWREKHISGAMKTYLEKRKKYDEFMEEELGRFEVGKRHIANMMGMDPKTMTARDVDEAVEYLFPSGLFDKEARPQLKHPARSMPKEKVAAFGMDGRPFNFLYYTGMPEFYTVMFEAGQELQKLKKAEAEHITQDVPLKTDVRILSWNRQEINTINTAGEWITREGFSKRFTERVSETDYLRLVVLLDKILYHPLAGQSLKFLRQFRTFHELGEGEVETRTIKKDKDGRECVSAHGKRKKSHAKVTVRDKGTGQVTINGQPLIKYFRNMNEREQLLFPLQHAELVGDVDIVATVTGPEDARMSHAGAIRLALSRALASFARHPADYVTQMRIMGMLSADPRQNERKKPGQKRARKKFTWKRR